MSHRIWRESKLQPSRARSGHLISCCLISLCFLCDILQTFTVQVVVCTILHAWPCGHRPTFASEFAEREANRTDEARRPWPAGHPIAWPADGRTDLTSLDIEWKRTRTMEVMNRKSFGSIIERAEFLPKGKIVRKKKFRWKSQMVKSWAENTHRRRTAPSCVNSLRLSFSHPSLDTCDFCLNRLSVLPEMNEKREHVSQKRLNLAEWVILVFQQKEPKYFSKIFGPKFGTQSQCRSQNFHKSVTLSTRNFAPFGWSLGAQITSPTANFANTFSPTSSVCLSTLLFYEAGPPKNNELSIPPIRWSFFMWKSELTIFQPFVIN